MAGPRQKFLSLQAGRAIAALLVLLHHAAHFLADPARWNRPEIFRRFTGPAFGVDTFFVLSGIVILTAHREDQGRPSQLLSYLWKRFRRIYPIFWLVLAATIMVQVLGHDPQVASQLHPVQLLSAFLLIDFQPQAIVPVAWTLNHEVMFYGCFALLIVNRGVGAVALTLWLLLSFMHFRDSNVLSFFSPLHLLFGLGLVASWLLHRGRIWKPWVLLAAGLLLVMAVLVAAGVAEPTSWEPLVAGFGSMLALLGAAELEVRGSLAVPAWLIFLGDASYSIYLIHFMAMSKFSKLFFAMNAHLSLPAWFWLTALCVGGTLCGCVLHVLVERPLLKLLGRPRSGSSVASASVLPAR